MDRLRITATGQPLKGEIVINGAKNSVLPLLAASLLTDQPLKLQNVPYLSDVKAMLMLLAQHGVDIPLNSPYILNSMSPFVEDSSLNIPLLGEKTLEIQAENITNPCAPYDIVRKMRASILVLGPLLARCGQAQVSLPGGCAIGARPVDLHIKGLIALGATIDLQQGYIIAEAKKGLQGGEFTFPIVSVTGTANVLMAACLAKGESKLINVAREPEVVDLMHCLNKMGAQIEGAGTDVLHIQGVDSLHGTDHYVLADRIEAGSYMVAAAITKGDIFLKHASLQTLPTFIPLLKEAGVSVEDQGDGLRITCHGLKSVDGMTEPFPGLPTDLQAQLMALMTQAEGASMITETIWENRFMHVPELMRLGANITVHRSSALVRGATFLKGAQVMATDLRASMSLVLAGLIAEGETIINRVYHLDRGYEKIEDKLNACGAFIERLSKSA